MATLNKLIVQLNAETIAGLSDLQQLKETAKKLQPIANQAGVQNINLVTVIPQIPAVFEQIGEAVRKNQNEIALAKSNLNALNKQLNIQTKSEILTSARDVKNLASQTNAQILVETKSFLDNFKNISSIDEYAAKLASQSPSYKTIFGNKNPSVKNEDLSTLPASDLVAQAYSNVFAKPEQLQPKANETVKPTMDKSPSSTPSMKP